jgi:cobalt-precorrin 5A hydrolase
MIAIGVGCRRGSSAEAIEAVVRETLLRVPSGERLGLFTIRDKAGEPGLIEAAERIGLALVPLSREALLEQTPRVLTRSARIEQMFGVPSVAEAAALAGAGVDSVLVVPRVAGRGVTCAVAQARVSR